MEVIAPLAGEFLLSRAGTAETPACRCQEFALASGRPRPRVLCALVPLIQERGTYGTPRDFAPPPLVEVLTHAVRSFFIALHP